MSKPDTEAGRRPNRKAARWHWYRTYPAEWTDGSASKLTLEEVGLLMILHTHAIEREGPIPGDAMLHLARQRRGNARSAKRIAQSLARLGLLKIAGSTEAEFSVLPVHAIDEIANRLSLRPDDVCAKFDEVCAKFDESLDEVSSNISKKRNEINADFAQSKSKSKSESDTDAPPTGGPSVDTLIESSPAHARERARRTREEDCSSCDASTSQAERNLEGPDGPLSSDEVGVGGDAYIALEKLDDWTAHVVAQALPSNPVLEDPPAWVGTMPPPDDLADDEAEEHFELPEGFADGIPWGSTGRSTDGKETTIAARA